MLCITDNENVYKIGENVNFKENKNGNVCLLTYYYVASN